jgi:hypothetical protein
LELRCSCCRLELQSTARPIVMVSQVFSIAFCKDLCICSHLRSPRACPFLKSVHHSRSSNDFQPVRTRTLASLPVSRACHRIGWIGRHWLHGGRVRLVVDRSLGEYGNERIGREEEGTSSGRAEMGAYAAILRRTPHHEDLVTATDSETRNSNPPQGDNR